MATRPDSPAVQEKLGEIARIIARAAELTGDEGRAIIWFRHQPIPGFGKTAEQLVEEGETGAVWWALESMDQGAIPDDRIGSVAGPLLADARHTVASPPV